MCLSVCPLILLDFACRCIPLSLQLRHPYSDACTRFVQVLGLKTLFPIFMGKGLTDRSSSGAAGGKKKQKKDDAQLEGLCHIRSYTARFL